MNWNDTIKTIEEQAEASVFKTIEDTRKKFVFDNDEFQLQEVLKEISAMMPIYPNTYERKDFHTQGTEANVETRFIYHCSKLISAKKARYKPEHYAEVLCSNDIPNFILNYTDPSNPDTNVDFLKIKYKGQEGVVLALQNSISCATYSNFLIRTTSEDFLPTDMPPSNTEYLRKFLDLPLLNNEESPVKGILQFNIGHNHEIRKVENYFLILDTLHGLRMFTNKDGNLPTKKEFFRDIDTIFTLPNQDKFSNYIYQAKSKLKQDDVLSIFEKMLEYAKKTYLK